METSTAVNGAPTRTRPVAVGMTALDSLKLSASRPRSGSSDNVEWNKLKDLPDFAAGIRIVMSKSLVESPGTTVLAVVSSNDFYKINKNRANTQSSLLTNTLSIQRLASSTTTNAEAGAEPESSNRASKDNKTIEESGTQIPAEAPSLAGEGSGPPTMQAGRKATLLGAAAAGAVCTILFEVVRRKISAFFANPLVLLPSHQLHVTKRSAASLI